MIFSVWTVHEQVCVAALDCGDQEAAEVPVKRITINSY